MMIVKMDENEEEKRGGEKGRSTWRGRGEVVECNPGGGSTENMETPCKHHGLQSMKWMLTIFTLIHLRIITTSQQFVTRGLEILNPSRSTITITNTMTVIMTIFIFLLLIMTDQFVTRGLAILGPSSSLPSSLSSPPSSSSSLSLKYLAAFLPETNLRDF